MHTQQVCMCFRDNHASSNGCHSLKRGGIKGEPDTAETSLKPSDLGCLSLQGRLLSKCFVPSGAGRKNLFLVTFFFLKKV